MQQNKEPLEDASVVSEEFSEEEEEKPPSQEVEQEETPTTSVADLLAREMNKFVEKTGKNIEEESSDDE